MMGSRCCFLSSSLHLLPVVLLPLCVEMVRVHRESVVLAGACEMGIMYLRMPGDDHYANGEKKLK